MLYNLSPGTMVGVTDVPFFKLVDYESCELNQSCSGGSASQKAVWAL